MNSKILFTFIPVLFLSGCATPVPIRELTSTGNPNASKISITSINEANWLDKTSVLPGKIYIDGVSYGEFSRNQKEFSAEVLPGIRLIVVCPENDAKCINAQLNVLPNKNYRYKYTMEQIYLVVALQYVWKLIPLGVEDYKPLAKNTATSAPSTNSKLESENNSQIDERLNAKDTVLNSTANTEIELKMKDGKERCIALGFQVGTQSFGECILKISK